MKAILFDLDGTLLDTAPDFHTALNRLLSEEGRINLDTTQVRHMVSNGSATLVSQAFNLDMQHAQFEPLRQRLLKHYADCLLENTRPFPGITECLALLRDRRISWGVVTNKPLVFSEAIMRGLDLYPDTLICPDHVQHPKPDPEGIMLACGEIGCTPADCVFVGDHQRDIDAGRSAGCGTVAAAYGYLGDSDNPEDWHADHIIWQPEQLLLLLESYFS